MQLHPCIYEERRLMIYQQMIESEEIDESSPYEEAPKLSCEDEDVKAGQDVDKREDGETV
jgi:hypothetical protein